MMPEAAAVIQAARYFLENADVIGQWEAPLAEAVAALDAKLLTIGGPASKVEQDRTWGEVVAGDEILSTKTMKFYEVHTSVRQPDSKMKVMIKGAPKPILRPVGDPVRVRRGVDGEAVDILEVLFSGQTAPSEIKSIEDKEADDE